MPRRRPMFQTIFTLIKPILKKSAFTLAGFVFPFVKKWLINEFNKESTKEYIVNKINELIDIPKMEEDREKEFIEKLYNSIVIIFNGFIKQK